jgi:hypothetical protein
VDENGRKGGRNGAKSEEIREIRGQERVKVSFVNVKRTDKKTGRTDDDPRILRIHPVAQQRSRSPSRYERRNRSLLEEADGAAEGDEGGSDDLCVCVKRSVSERNEGRGR